MKKIAPPRWTSRRGKGCVVLTCWMGRWVALVRLVIPVVPRYDDLFYSFVTPQLVRTADGRLWWIGVEFNQAFVSPYGVG